MLIAWVFGDVSWLSLTLMVCFLVGLASVIGNRDNLLFFSRTVFIVWIGFIPALALYMGGYFAWRMPFVQTQYVAFVLTIITTFALFSSQVGLEFGKKVPVRERGMDLRRNERVMFFFLLSLLFVVGTMIALDRGEVIFVAGYTSEEQLETRVEMPLKNFPALVAVLSLFSYILLNRMERFGGFSSSKLKRYRLMFWLCILYVTVWCQFLRGARMDPLTILFGISVLFLIYKNGNLLLRKKYLLYLLLAFFVLQVWGGVRHDIKSLGLDRIIDIAQGLYKSERDGVPIFFRQGTMNDLSLSVATVIYAIEEGDLEYRYGGSYLDYILRTPPKFLYPDRPKSLAWLPDDLYGGGGSGGGFNEMAETYLNFGVYGSLLIPGIISFLLSFSYRQFLANRYNIIRSLLFLSILSVFFRGLLYQTFAFYKTFITALVIYVVVVFVHQVIVNRFLKKTGIYVRSTRV